MKSFAFGGLLALVVGFSLAGCSARVSTGAGEPPAPNQPAPAAGTQDASANLRAEPYWFACKSNADCIMEPGVCGQPEAVNTGYLEKYRDFRDRLAQMIECAERPVLPEVVQTQCVKQRCALKGKEGKVTPDGA